MNTFNSKRIAMIVSTVLSVGVVTGCEYCQPLLLATVSIAVIAAAIRWLKTNMSEDLVEIFSHTAH